MLRHAPHADIYTRSLHDALPISQLQIVGEQAGVAVWAPEPGNGVGDPVQVARTGVEHAQQKLYDVVIVDTAGRLGRSEEHTSELQSLGNLVCGFLLEKKKSMHNI